MKNKSIWFGIVGGLFVGLLIFYFIGRDSDAIRQLKNLQAHPRPIRSYQESAVEKIQYELTETGQKRIVLMSDGNENIGDVMGAVAQAKAQGASLDVVALGASRGSDVFVQKVQVPTKLKKGQPFEAKIFIQADEAQEATVRLYRNDVPLGEQKVKLEAGKNLFSFPQTLPDQGFYNYDVRVDAPGDLLPQNNRAMSFASTAIRTPSASFLEFARRAIRTNEPSWLPGTRP